MENGFLLKRRNWFLEKNLKNIRVLKHFEKVTSDVFCEESDLKKDEIDD